MTFRNALLFGAAFLSGIMAAPGVVSTVGATGVLIPVAHAEAAPSTPAQDSGNHAETYRLLTLFGSIFDLVRANYVEPVSDRELITNALNGMLSGLDPHSSYMTEKQYADMQVQTSGKFGGLGLEVQGEDGHVRVVSPIDGTPAWKAGIKPGDYIVAIDGHNIDGSPLNDAVEKMRGKPDTKITLTIIRAKTTKPIIVTLTREIIRIEAVKAELYDKTGYIRIPQFTEDTAEELRKAYAELKRKAGGKLTGGLVLDLRNDPGGLLTQAIDVSSFFIPSGEIVSTRARHPKDSQRWDAKGTDATDGLPIVVLINGGSASASEIVSGALQDHHRAVLIGTKSFGKGSVQTIMPIPGNGAVRLTTARYYTPSGRSIQGLGIAPDIVVKESREDPVFSIREADLSHILKNQGGNQTKPPARNDLPALSASIPHEPPANWPTFDITKPATDFQLQEGLRLVRSMAGVPAPDPVASLPPAPTTTPAKNEASH
ncbi:carboxy-terminal processing protease [Acetobacter estunensis NRIC 0472]|uniref:PDZ domain-containing protein n=1 Tax=Acetobacter estunensis TaxID=104097 RepID=A0A967EBX9_9PROT|nr:S41 family peptidase [Acetobacter estunensis]NHO53978.1 PDZ domain-containing protein [Acetobacter estunensis]GBQ20684.1 carboxy-terminal processing protease [Acetobacter estunensis NRIC 0472]